MKSDVLAELHALYYVKPYDEDEDILKEDLAEALGCTPKYAAEWARNNPQSVEAYDVRLPNGKTAKAYRMVSNE